MLKVSIFQKYKNSKEKGLSNSHIENENTNKSERSESLCSHDFEPVTPPEEHQRKSLSALRLSTQQEVERGSET